MESRNGQRFSSRGERSTFAKKGTGSLQRHETAHKAVEWKLTRNSVSPAFVCLFLFFTIRSKAEKSFFRVKQSSVWRRLTVRRTYTFTTPAVWLSPYACVSRWIEHIGRLPSKALSQSVSIDYGTGYPRRNRHSSEPAKQRESSAVKKAPPLLPSLSRENQRKIIITNLTLNRGSSSEGSKGFSAWSKCCMRLQMLALKSLIITTLAARCKASISLQPTNLHETRAHIFYQSLNGFLHCLHKTCFFCK